MAAAYPTPMHWSRTVHRAALQAWQRQGTHNAPSRAETNFSAQGEAGLRPTSARIYGALKRITNGRAEDIKVGPGQVTHAIDVMLLFYA